MDDKNVRVLICLTRGYGGSSRDYGDMIWKEGLNFRRIQTSRDRDLWSFRQILDWRQISLLKNAVSGLI